MLIIHSFFAENSFYLWGEKSFKFGDVPTFHSCAEDIQLLPWGADASSLDEALKKLKVRSKGKASAVKTVSAYALLPSKNSIPIPSSQLLGEIPNYKCEPILNKYEIQVLHLKKEELYSLFKIIKMSGEKLYVPGILFADDIIYISEALDYAVTMISKGSFFPDMKREKESFVSTWSPMHLARHQDKHNSFIENLPPILRSFSLLREDIVVKNSKETAEAILHFLLDDVVRDSQTHGSSGRKINSKNPHEIWIRSLTWPKAPLSNWQEEMESLYPQIREWTDSLKAVTIQPWRLLLKIEEPFAEGLSWNLSWFLQSTRNSSLILSAARVWSPDKTEKERFVREKFNPRKYMLQTLGHIAPLIPLVAKSLDSPYPSNCQLSSDDFFEFLQKQLPLLLEQGVQIKLPLSWESITDRPKVALKGFVLDRKSFFAKEEISLSDLLPVQWNISIGDEVLTEEEINFITKEKTPLINFRGKWLLLYKDEFRKILDGRNSLPTKVSRKSALILAFCESHSNIPLSGITGSQWLDSVKTVLTGAGEIEMLSQPTGFLGRLRPYQIRGFSWMSWIARLGLGCCLADDMGLGKTVQTLALIQFLRNEGEKRPSLLICPTSVIENWKRETDNFIPGTTVLIHHGTRRLKGEKFVESAYENNLVVSSYSLLYRDREYFNKVNWSGIILDEAQNIKNPDTRQAKSAKTLKGDWRLALTGTPIENHVGDIWSLMDFLLPGLLPQRGSFIREFLHPIQAGEKAAMERIRRITAPFILRRLKSDKKIISDLPQKIETQVYCSLGKEQAALYASVVNSAQNEIYKADGIRRKGLILSTITALKQICNHPTLYLKDKPKLEGRSGKLQRLTEITEEILSTGNKTLIFTQYVSMGEILKNYLQETFGKEVLFLHGALSKEKRDEFVDRFQAPNSTIPFFILSLKAGGTGLNLTNANHVIMFDRWWNPAVEQQAVDRAYRIGQKNSVQVHYFCCKGTVEEKIENLINSKLQIAGSVIGTGEKWLTDLSDKELRELFSLKHDAIEDVK